MKAIIHEQLYQRGKTVFQKSKIKYFLTPLNNEKKIIKLQRRHSIPIIVLDSKPLSDQFFLNLSDKTHLIRFGVGVSNINLNLCKKRKIKIFNVKNAHVQTTAEYTWSLILSLTKKITILNQNFKNNLWKKIPTLELVDKTIAIIGLGKTGSAVARIAKLAFNMQVWGISHKLPKRPIPYIDKVFTQLDEAIPHADIVSFHLSHNPQYPLKVDDDFLKLMKQEAFLINLTRGNLINEKYLYQFLKQKKIAGVALDVFNHEPYQPYQSAQLTNRGKRENYDLRNLENVILTPHNASNTPETNFKTTKEIEKIIKQIYSKSEKILKS